MPFLGDCAVRHMGAVLAEMEASLFPALAGRRTAMPVVPPAARASTPQHQLAARRPGRARGGLRRLAGAGGARPLPDGDRPALPGRGGDRRGEGRVPRHRRAGAASGGASRYEIRDMLRGAADDDRAATRRWRRRWRGRSRRCSGATPEFVVSPGTYDQKHIDRIGRLQELRRLRPGHTRPRAPARRICRRRRHARRRHGDGPRAGRSARRGWRRSRTVEVG